MHLMLKISKEGFKFAVLLRLSPLPSWINTYGLALTNIPFPSYVAATLYAFFSNSFSKDEKDLELFLSSFIMCILGP